MNNAKWIWYWGDYEIYHSLKLHERREQYGTVFPPFWYLPSPYPQVEFRKTVEAPCDFTVTVRAKGKGYVRIGDGPLLPVNKPLVFPKGTHRLLVHIVNPDGLPAIYINSPYLSTDESFAVVPGGNGTAKRVAASCTPAYGEDEDPNVFPFAYTEPLTATQEQVEGGTLYDFGRETFGPVTVCGVRGRVGIFYGESREEALAAEKDCSVWEYAEKDGVLPPRAFRFIHVRGEAKLSACEEYLDIPEKGAFTCDDPQVERIWQCCARTFHLCSREFFLDGIKRDRWVWGGDARQALLISAYLFADREIARRTLISLFPKDFVFQHVNTIADYSLFTIISLWEYYELFGDAETVRCLWERVKLLYDFIHGRLDPETGLLVEREGDWIFIDWADLDKNGPLAAEQILLWQTEVCMARLAPLAGADGAPHRARADALRKTILALYFDKEQGAFIDSYTSGRRQVTRHAAILAILFDFADARMAEELFRRVLKNDAIPAIKTPYFKLYELMALCKAGDLVYAQEMLGSYWGKMLAMGATSMWEQFDPAQPIPACYEMYGNPYEKSLCHAWSAGPIYFLGRYCLGVSATAPGYETYEVRPKAGLYRSFSGTVPTARGNIHVAYESGRISVLSDLSGGTLIAAGREYAIPVGTPLTVEAEI